MVFDVTFVKCINFLNFSAVYNFARAFELKIRKP